MAVPLQSRPLPPLPAGILAMLGPAFIWASVAQGSGELIWWPYLAARYGTAFIGLLLPACLMQFFVNAEISRYTALTGEGIWSGFRKLGGWFSLPLFSLCFACLLWFGGYASAGGTALFALTGFPSGFSPRAGALFWGYATMAMFTVGMFKSSMVYRLVELFMKGIAVITVTGLLISLCQPGISSAAAPFLAALCNPLSVRLPADFPISDAPKLVTAIAFAGMGGFFNLMYSYWIREKGVGMSGYAGKVTRQERSTNGEQQELRIEESEESRANWQQWLRYLRWDNLLGVAINTLTVAMTTLLALALLHPKGLYPQGWNLAVAQAEFFSAWLGTAGRILFLIIAAAFLGDSWLGVADGVARQYADFTLSHFKRARGKSQSFWYYRWLLFLIIATSITMPLAQPGVLIEIGGVINIFAFVLYIPALYYLNHVHLPRLAPPWTHPAKARGGLLWLIWAAYAVIAILYLALVPGVIPYFVAMLIVILITGGIGYRKFPRQGTPGDGWPPVRE